MFWVLQPNIQLLRGRPPPWSSLRAQRLGTLLRPARSPKGAESAAHIRRLMRQIAKYWPGTGILLRADSHYCTPEGLDLCDGLGLRYIFGLSKNGRLAQNISALEASTATRYARTPGQKQRRFKTFSYAARSWSKPRRVIARVEVGPMGRDTRYIVTNLEGGRGKHLYEKLYSARGQAENHIKAWKTHLASDRTSCSKANANQMRVRPAYAAPPGPRSGLTAARLRLLALVEIARGLPEAFTVAPRPVRHTAAAPRQAGRHHRREKDPDHRHSAGILSPARTSPPSLRRPRPTESSLTQAPRPHQNINPYYPTATSTTGKQTGRRHLMRATDPRRGKPAQ